MCVLENSNDEIDIYKVLLLYWNNKIKVLSTTLLFAICGVLISLVITPKYQSKITLYIDSTTSSSNLGGVASMLGLGASANTGTAILSSLLDSKYLYQSFIKKHSLKEELYFGKDFNEENPIPSDISAAKYFLKKTFKYDLSKTGDVLSLQITHQNPETAKLWADLLYDHLIKILDHMERSKNDSALNFYTNKISEDISPVFKVAIQNLYEDELKKTLMIGKAKFQVIDPAMVGEKPVSPNKILFTIGFAALGFMLISVFIGIRNRFTHFLKS